MTTKQRAALCVEALKKEYPEAICSLDYEKPYELLFATRLAAQCTDLRVNKVTAVLYKKFPTLEAIAQAGADAVEEIVRPCGLGRTKARDIVAAAQMLLDNFGGVVPNTMENLLKLPGVGRKTANLILGDVFHLPAIVVDTHCIRITNLLGLSTSQNANVVEKELQKVLDPKESNDFCHRIVLHGRAVCVARRPQCKECCMWENCKNAPVKPDNQ